MKKMHLICNAHLDPVWLWQRQEGVGETLSTFRIAADFCENYKGFVFNHNEAVLYEWVEEFEPDLFKKIQNLVTQGKWHIMGGWYLQPDCTMPSGESLARQMIYGKNYFMKKFGVEPKTAINFDSFGHSKGMVQIMNQAGYDSYIFSRPSKALKELPSEDFTWVGFNNKSVTASRAFHYYLSGKGKSVNKINSFLREYPEKEKCMVLWGIGNHGGGPSKEDLEAIQAFRKENTDIDIIHSTPEAYFSDLKDTEQLKSFDKSLNPFAIGCYTSQIRLKQKHRLLENELFMTEKMMTAACANGVMNYDRKQATEALKDLMFCEFHDILPGSSIQIVEEDALRQLDHGLEISNKLKTKAFYMLLRGEEAGDNGVLPIFAYNHHPYEVKGVFECEFMNEFVSSKIYSIPEVKQDGKIIPSQNEREASGLHALDWRKKVVFTATLKPSAMNRFDLTLTPITKKKTTYKFRQYVKNGNVAIKTDELDIKISKITGLVDTYKVNGENYLEKSAFRLAIYNDTSDAWAMETPKINDLFDYFRLMTTKEARNFGQITRKEFDPVRVIEDGDSRIVIDTYFKYGDSAAIITYLIPKHGTNVEVKVRVYWNEKEKMLRLSIPTTMKKASYMGQTANGVEQLFEDGTECVSQKWSGVFDSKQNKAFVIIDDCLYGSFYKKGTINLSLVRSPGYSGHPKGNNPMMIDDRIYPRIDQGERTYSFMLMAGEENKIKETVDKLALAYNEKPYIITAYPAGEGKTIDPIITLSNEAILLQAMKLSENSDEYVIRLYNSTDTSKETTIISKPFKINESITFNGFEIKTYVIKNGNLIESDLLERPNK
ncbi:MAG: alpha-mannosidase [Clostridiales bacterium]|nr:alpha-mannosidase [Clostridiales bacterium]